MPAIEHMNAKELTQAYQQKSLSPVEVTKDALDRIEKINPLLNAFCLVDHEGALAQAKAAEQRWMDEAPLSPMDGVPSTIKDLLLNKELPTGYGSHLMHVENSTTDAPAVARLREAGAVLLGMTNSPEIGWKGVTDSPRFDITRNPWNPERTPGGSSGGAAVAAALNLGWFHLGTDGGGSIRMPSAFSGTFGHKATFGYVPAYPLSPMGTLAHVGPMTRTVEDGVNLLNIIAQPDNRDWYALPPQPKIKLARSGDKPLAGLRIAVSLDLGYMNVAPDVIAAVKNSAQILSDLGAIVEEAAPAISDPKPLFETLWFAAARHRISGIPDDQRHLLDQGLVEATEEFAHLTLADYLAANLERGALGVTMEAFFQEWDAIITPTLPFTAFKAGQQTPSGEGRWTDWAGFNFPFNLSQQPSCSICCGLCNEGLPIGLQISSAKFKDALVLEIARAFETANPASFKSVSDLI